MHPCLLASVQRTYTPQELTSKHVMREQEGSGVGVCCRPRGVGCFLSGKFGKF